MSLAIVFASISCAGRENFIDGEIGRSYREFVEEGENNVTSIRITPPYEDSDTSSVFKKDSYMISDFATVRDILMLLRSMETKVTRVQNDQEYASKIFELTKVDLSGNRWIINRYQLQLYNHNGEHLTITVYEEGMAVVHRDVGRAYFESADNFLEQMRSIEHLMTKGTLEKGSIGLLDIEIF